MRSFLPLTLALIFLSGVRPAGGAVSFRTEIAPLLQRHCATCHNEDNAKGKYRLDTFDLFLKAGDSEEPPIVPGHAQDSELYRRLVETDPTERMPQKADALVAEEISKVDQWITEGAVFDGGARSRPLVELAREALLHASPAKYLRPLPITALAFNADGSQIAVSGYYEVTVWNADGSLTRRIPGLPERITSLAWQPGSNLLAVAGGTPGQWGAVVLVAPDGGSPPRFLCDMSETALSVAFSPDGTVLAAGGGDRTVRLFDPINGRQLRLLRHHADWVQTVSFDQEGSHLVTASRDRTSRIIDVATGEVGGGYTGHESPVLAACFANRKSRVISLDRSRSLQTWDIYSLQKLGDFKEFEGEPRELLLWNDNVVAAGTSKTVTVHQLSDRQQLFALTGHHDSVGAIALSPDHTTLASGSADGEVLIWDLSCGTWLRRFVASPGW